MSKKNVLPLLILILLLPSIAISEAPGNATGAFLDLGIGARPLSMGQAFCALAEDGNAFYYNPAGLINTKDAYVDLSYQKLALDRFLGNFSTGVNLYDDAAVALSVTHSQVMDIYRRDTNGEKQGNLKNGEEQITVSFMKVISEKAGIAANLKYVQKTISEVTAYSVGFDIGVYGEFIPNRLAGGFSVLNINTEYPWNTSDYYFDGITEDSKFPKKMRAGLAYFLPKLPVTLTLDALKTGKKSLSLHGGVEGHISENFALRAGLNHKKPTFGFGLSKRFGELTISLDYAYVIPKLEGISSSHIIDLKTEF